MTILCIDFMNQCHRARSGFQAGDHAVVYNFFRQFKALVDEFKPTRVYMVLEGKPVHRHDSMAEYKANRIVQPDDPKYAEMQKFYAQKTTILELLNGYFPVSVVRHPTSEADDTIANLVKRSSPTVPWTLVSSDTDFIQLLQSHKNLRIWNPVRKEFVVAPTEYDYVIWKSLRGDASDNIPGVPGVGDKTAAKIASDPDKLAEYIRRPDVEPIFTRNYSLIRFMEWSDADMDNMTCSTPSHDWNSVKDSFTTMGFNSVVKDGSWQKFIKSFDNLWG